MPKTTPISAATKEFLDGNSAKDLLHEAENVLHDRGQQYGGVRERRTMDKVVAVFNAATGKSLSVHEGWLFMVSLKLARAANEWTPARDTYVDGANYFFLAGEEILK